MAKRALKFRPYVSYGQLDPTTAKLEQKCSNTHESSTHKVSDALVRRYGRLSPGVMVPRMWFFWEERRHSFFCGCGHFWENKYFQRRATSRADAKTIEKRSKEVTQSVVTRSGSFLLRFTTVCLALDRSLRLSLQLPRTLKPLFCVFLLLVRFFYSVTDRKSVV